MSFEQKPATGGTPIFNSEFNSCNVPSNHQQMQRLLANAFEYLNPAHGILDAHSGYPVEGWNQEPENGLFLRSFTQLTAIGAWIELLSNIAAGYAETAYFSKDEAFEGLALAVTTLLQDQTDPALAAKGLMVNFMGLKNGERVGPLRESVEKREFIETFGERDGLAIWRAVIEKGWMREEDSGRKGRLHRDAAYGANYFDGALAPYSDTARKAAIMRLLDQRAVTIIFGDNANLTAALARSVGALLRDEIRHDPRAAALRDRIEGFIAAQNEGYSYLYDARTGTFVFGWDAAEDRFVGWEDGRGNWVTGQMNYFINEFRGPLMFTMLRYGLPSAAIRNAGFKIKPYPDSRGKDNYALAAWDGSAFQLLGLSLFMQESRNPGWRSSLETLVDIALDFSNRNGLPGFLSEAYSGQGTEYTGLIGIPDLAVTDAALNTHAPSLYTLGVAYMIAPDKVERFLQDHWPLISGLFTAHGPWEGWDASRQQIIPYQTTVHTLSLILGGINSAHQNMHRYLEANALYPRLEALYAPGEAVDFLAMQNQIHAWSAEQTPFEFSRNRRGSHFTSTLTARAGMTFTAPEGQTISLSNGRLVLRYRSATRIDKASISLTRAQDDPLPLPSIPIEISTRFQQTPDAEITIQLPATPALQDLKAATLTFHDRDGETPIDISIRRFDFRPFTTAIEARP